MLYFKDKQAYMKKLILAIFTVFLTFATIQIAKDFYAGKTDSGTVYL